MRLRTIAAVLALAVATAAPLPLLACPMPRAATEKCTPAPHCEQMPVNEPAASLEACANMSCCQLSTRPAESPATLKQANASEFEFSGVAFAQNVALPAAPAQELAPDSPLKVLPLERQALLCVFLI
jgi:hypothetical protein